MTVQEAWRRRRALVVTWEKVDAWHHRNPGKRLPVWEYPANPFPLKKMRLA